MSTYTPWGESQYSRKVIRGAVFHSTAGHGGLCVSEGIAGKCLSKYTVSQAICVSGRYWYEEDCAVSLPLYELLDFFPEKVCDFLGNKDVEAIRQSLEKSIRQWYPKYFETEREAFFPLPSIAKIKVGWTVEASTSMGNVRLEVLEVRKDLLKVSLAGSIYSLPKRVYVRGAREILDENGKTVWAA